MMTTGWRTLKKNVALGINGPPPASYRLCDEKKACNFPAIFQQFPSNFSESHFVKKKVEKYRKNFSVHFIRTEMWASEFLQLWKNFLIRFFEQDFSQSFIRIFLKNCMKFSHIGKIWRYVSVVPRRVASCAFISILYLSHLYTSHIYFHSLVVSFQRYVFHAISDFLHR